MLRFSGLDFGNVAGLKTTHNRSNFTDETVLEDIISKCKVKKEKFKTGRVYTIFESIVEEIYNR
jgi:hypothetical protein